MARRPRKGDRLIYTGGYATPTVPPYPPGTVVAFRNYGTKVTVLLDKQEGDTDDLYADWPIDQVAPAPTRPNVTQ